MKAYEKLPSRIEIIPEFLQRFLKNISPRSLNEDDLFCIRLSLGEALINAIKHGNKLNADLFVEVTMEYATGCLVISVKDQGKGFDFHNLPDPRKPENLAELYGRGIFLIKSMMDGVEFFAGGSGIKMTKFLHKEAKT
jgi:serine/threonine-protein kinase RsbW